MNKLVFAFAAAVMAASVTGFTTSPAMAAANQQTIDIAPFDLDSDAGRAAVASRIEKAAEAVCGSYDARNARAADSVRACRQQAADDALAQLGGLSRRGSVTVTGR